MKIIRIKYSVLKLLLLLTIVIGSIYFYIEFANKKEIMQVADLPNSDAVIVFGALVYSDESVSYVLARRLDTGIEAYKQGKAKKIIVSGDHGTKQYNEVAAMRNYLLRHGIPREDIFLDHAGFTTYDSIYRAKEIFEVNSAILVSQELHLQRALFIAKCLGLNAKGAAAVAHERDVIVQKFREIGARTKAFCQAALLKPEPRFLGDKIPVLSSNGIVTEPRSD